VFSSRSISVFAMVIDTGEFFWCQRSNGADPMLQRALLARGR
jgi:hypothetical protein